MELFTIFNKVLLELSYRPVSVFANIVKSEHLRILENINRVNADICSTFNWSFLEKADTLKVLANKTEAEGEIEGRIVKIYDKNLRYAFNPDYQMFYTGQMPQNTYGYFNNKVLFGKSPKDRELTVFYTSNKFVRGESGALKSTMECEKDSTIIPMPWAEQLLVYGTCLKTKANPNYPKFAFWNSMYMMALSNLRAKCGPTSEDEPSLVVKSRESGG